MKLILGNNFSGKSALLKRIVQYIPTIQKTHRRIYISEIPVDNLTGIMPTVKQELSLHDMQACYKELLYNLFFDLELNKYNDRNPYSLSGGEQAIISVICALLLNPDLLAIDITLEQLSNTWKSKLVSIMDTIECPIYLCDNRASEFERQINTHTCKKENFLFRNMEFYENNNVYTYRTQKLDLNEICFSYDKKQQILNNCSISLEGGYIYHLKGNNGAGKSTLAKILSGLLRPSNGKLYFNGKYFDTYKYPGQMVGYSFQNPEEQLFSSTVHEELLANNKQDKLTEYISSIFSLTALEKDSPYELPFVIKKRLAIASILTKDRNWYVFDEPTLGQDDKNMFNLVKIFNFLVKQGKGIILISHSNSFISSFENIKEIYLTEGKLE